MSDIELFTDGACSGNPGPGGWAAILRSGKHETELSGGAEATTNNRMELTAVIEGLRKLKRGAAVAIYTDSRYVMDGAETWLARWKARGWKTADRKPVKNVRHRQSRQRRWRVPLQSRTPDELPRLA